MNITNMGKGSRVLPLKNGKHVEIAPGQTVDFPDDEWAALAKRVTVSADIEAGVIVVVPGVVVTSATVAVDAKTASVDADQELTAISANLGTIKAGAPEAAETKRRGRPPKAKPSDDTSGEDA